jgi:ABC-2 type transport system permease protein
MPQAFGTRRPAGPSGEVAPEGAARILETGYRPYTGVRLGPAHSVRTLAVHTFERIVGLRRPARYKILPILCVLIAYLPAVAFIGATALLPQRRIGNFVPDPGQYFAFVIAALALFSTLAAPEALCPDKRSRVLGIYLASPLTRSTYLLAKVISVATAILLVTLGPPLVLLIGEAIQNDGPRGFGGFMTTLFQTVVAGLALAAFFTALALAIASFTDRRAFASAGGVLLIVGSAAISSILAFGLKLGDNWLLLGLDRIPIELTRRIFDRGGLPTPSGNPLSTTGVVAAFVIATALGAGLTWWRVVSSEVSR